MFDQRKIIDPSDAGQHQEALNKLSSNLSVASAKSAGPTRFAQPTLSAAQNGEHQVRLVLSHYQNPEGLRYCHQAASQLKGSGPPLILVSSLGEDRSTKFWLPAVVRQAASSAAIRTFDPYSDYTNPTVFNNAVSLLSIKEPRGQLLWCVASDLVKNKPSLGIDLLCLYGDIVQCVDFNIDRNRLLKSLYGMVKSDRTDDEVLFYKDRLRAITAASKAVNIDTSQEARELNYDHLSAIKTYLAKEGQEISVEEILALIVPAVLDHRGYLRPTPDLYLALNRMKETLGGGAAELADEVIKAAALSMEQIETAEILNGALASASWLAAKDSIQTKLKEHKGPILIVAPAYLEKGFNELLLSLEPG